MSLRKKTLVLGVGEGAARLLGVLIYALLARALTVAEFGVFSAAMTTALLVGVIVDFGQNAHVGRVAAREQTDGAGVLRAALVNKAVSGLLIAMLAVAGASLLKVDTTEARVLGVMVIWAALLSMLDTLRVFMRARGLMGVDSIVNGGESALRVAAVASAWALGAGMVGFSAAYAVASAIAFVAFALFVRNRYRSDFASPFTGPGGARLLRRTLPLGLSALAMAGFYRIDQVFVRVLVGPEASAYYGAAARMVFTASILTTLVASASYPEMSRARGDRSRLRHVLVRSFALALAIGVSAALFLWLFAEPLLVLMFGEEYGIAAPLLRLLSGVVALNAVSTIALYAANSLELEKRVLLLISVLALSNVALNLLFLPVYGAVAAGYVSLGGEMLLAAGLLLLSVRGYRAQPRE